MRRTHLSGDALQLLHRRFVVAVCAWVPLLLTIFSLEDLLLRLLKIVF